jgi:molecular chaperone GrpE
MTDEKHDSDDHGTGNGRESEDDRTGSGGGEAAGPGQGQGQGLELEKLKNDYLYLGAEFENYKKHAIKERSELIRYGSERFIRDLLEVVDNFERALNVELKPETAEKFREGVKMTHQELLALLHRHGVAEINPVGQPFDPSAHEALTSEETAEFAPGTIARVFKKAYRLYDKLLRPAQVVVAKAPSESKG